MPSKPVVNLKCARGTSCFAKRTNRGLNNILSLSGFNSTVYENWIKAACSGKSDIEQVSVFFEILMNNRYCEEARTAVRTFALQGNALAIAAIDREDDAILAMFDEHGF